MKKTILEWPPLRLRKAHALTLTVFLGTLSLGAHAQSNYSNQSNTPHPNNGVTNPIQAPVRVVIDGNQLINQQASQPKARPTPSDTLSSTPAPNNVRIGSGGQYSDSNSGKTEQINSSGQLCQSNQGLKKCY